MKKIIVLSFMVLCGVLLLQFDPTHDFWAPKCPFKLITGLSCPACGIQRFIHAFLHGQFAKALSYNYYLVFAGPYAGAFIVGWLLPDGKYKDNLNNFLEQKGLIRTYIVTFLLWLVIRNIYHL